MNLPTLFNLADNFKKVNNRTINELLQNITVNLFKSVDFLKKVWHNNNVNGTNERTSKMIKELVKQYEEITTTDVTSDEYCKKMDLRRAICNEICKNTGLEYKKVSLMFSVYKKDVIELINKVE